MNNLSEEEKAQIDKAFDAMSEEDKAKLRADVEMTDAVIQEMLGQVSNLVNDLGKFNKQYSDLLHHVPYGITICASLAGVPLIQCVLGRAIECKLCLRTLLKSMYEEAVSQEEAKK